jgi:hypothetical protein
MIPKADNSCGIIHNGIIAEPISAIPKTYSDFSFIKLNKTKTATSFYLAVI